MASNDNECNSPASRSRRDLIKTAAVTGVAAWLAAGKFPAILRADDKAGDKPLIVGEGEHQYEWVDNWPKRPEEKKFGNTHSVVEVGDGRIFVHHTGPESIHVYDPDGKFIESFGKEFAGHAHGMDLRKEDGEEYLYLAATSAHKAYKIDLKGKILMTLDYPRDGKDPHTGKPCYESGAKFVPTYTAFAPNGDFYVTDGYGAGYVHHYTMKGEFVQSFAGKGNGEDQTACPHGVFCDTRTAEKPILVVADRAHHRLQYFSLDGKLDHLVTNETADQKNGKDENGKLRLPCQFSQRGTELLVPDLRGRVTVLDKENNAVAQLGDNPNAHQRANNKVAQADTTPGHFCCPHGAMWDSKGNIFVAEWLPYGRVTKLRKLA